MMPSCSAMDTASSFECASRRVRMLWTWLRTVLTLRWSSWAMAAVLAPRARSWSTSTSRRLRRSAGAAGTDAGQQLGEQAGSQGALALAHRADRRHQLVDGLVLQEVPGCAGLQRADDGAVVGLRAHHQHASGRVHGADPDDAVRCVAVRQAEVHDHHVGPQGAGGLRPGGERAGDARHHHVVLPLQRDAQPLGDHGVVFDDEHTGRRGIRHSATLSLALSSSGAMSPPQRVEWSCRSHVSLRSVALQVNVQEAALQSCRA